MGKGIRKMPNIKIKTGCYKIDNYLKAINLLFAFMCFHKVFKKEMQNLTSK